MHHGRLAAGIVAACAMLVSTGLAAGPVAGATASGPGGSISAPTSGTGTTSDPYLAHVTVVAPTPQLRTDALRDNDGALNIVARDCGPKSADAGTVDFTFLGYAAPSDLTWTPRYPDRVDDGCTDGTYRVHLISGSSPVPHTFEPSAYVVRHDGVTPGTYLLTYDPAPDVTVTYRHRRAATSSAAKNAVFLNEDGKVIYRGAGPKMPAKKRAKVRSWTATVQFDDYANKTVAWTRRLRGRMVPGSVRTNGSGVATFRFTKDLGTFAGYQKVTRQVSYPQRLVHPVALFTAPGEANHFEAFQCPFGPMSPA